MEPVGKSGRFRDFIDAVHGIMEFAAGVFDAFACAELLRRFAGFFAEEADEAVFRKPGAFGKFGVGIFVPQIVFNEFADAFNARIGHFVEREKIGGQTAHQNSDYGVCEHGSALNVLPSVPGRDAFPYQFKGTSINIFLTEIPIVSV